TYSEYSESRLNNGGTEFYIVVSSTYFTATYEYYAYFYNDDSQGVWRKAEYDTMISSGRTRYYGLLVSMPAGYANMRLVRMKKNTDPDLSLASALSEGGPVNTSMNAYVISSIDGAMINGDYSTVSVEGGSSGKAAYSAKGIKAGNDISINKGSVTIMSNDDAVHAKNDTTLENGKKGTGNVTISGGTVTITCTDDALHADGDLTINDGTVNIVKCYEGLEGNVITINGGSSFVFAYDDGMNASKGNSAALIKITGGYLEVTTPSGDTDAVDSNGNFIQTGGFVLIKGGSASGGVAGSVDVDGKINITGGNIAALGGVCETPTDSVNAYVSGNTTFEAGSYELKDDAGNLVMSFVLSDKYQGGWLASESLKTGTNYTLYKDGTAALTWTQESGTMGASGFGGWGGSHGGRR
ncbi:MAG: carbohydrate-binding domain-containing protein, partial [Lachnospiraceae bacterium]|nr:carbohydrate-binding domain-containing protein [Lachnospiraceae bacterium]